LISTWYGLHNGLGNSPISDDLVPAITWSHGAYQSYGGALAARTNLGVTPRNEAKEAPHDRRGERGGDLRATGSGRAVSRGVGAAPAPSKRLGPVPSAAPLKSPGGAPPTALLPTNLRRIAECELIFDSIKAQSSTTDQLPPSPISNPGQLGCWAPGRADLSQFCRFCRFHVEAVSSLTPSQHSAEPAARQQWGTASLQPSSRRTGPAEQPRQKGLRMECVPTGSRAAGVWDQGDVPPATSLP
jgi:hypothetical protein